jgi:transcriptional regulator
MNKDKPNLLQGTLDLIVLQILQAGPANGWDITQKIQVLSEDILSVNYGSLYPSLQRLETRGWVTSEWALSDNNRRAKFYKLTAAGRRRLEAERKAWERFSGALELILRTS